MLYPHQEEALNKLKPGSVLCGGTGSGKSLTALAYFFNRILLGDFEHYIVGVCEPCVSVDLYIITTPRKRDTHEWEDELKNVHLKLGENVFSNDVKCNVVVDSWNNIEKYQSAYNAFFIFDEQRVVGYGAWVKAFLSITWRNRWILLSATPGDTWMDYIPLFIANHYYKNKTDFIRQHVIYSRFSKYPKVDRYVDVGRLIKQRNEILVPMKIDRQTTQYHIPVKVKCDRQKVIDMIRYKCDPETKEPYKDAGELCLRMRQFVNADPSRCEAIGEIYHAHKRLIIFYNYTFEATLIKRYCAEHYITYAEWNGQAHQEIPNTDSWVFIVQYTAGCEGWNCTLTDTIIFYSESYSYKQMVQAAGRIDRINTPYTELFYYHLKSDAPIDLAISSALKRKKNFNTRIYA